MPIIQAVERALKILDLFDEHETELKITDISERMGLHKSTVHSLLKTLQVHGYIDQNAENGKYKLGMKLFERGNFVLQGLDIRHIAKKYLLDLSTKTGQTTHLVLLDGKEGVYIDKVEGPQAVILYSRIGRRIPVHSSAVGKALVAFSREDEVQRILKNYVYVSHTDRTISSEQEFLNELVNVRKAGHAVDMEENEPGVRCVAVPIFDHKGQPAAAISMSTLISRVNDEKLQEYVSMLKKAAKDMSAEMGYGMVSL
ncbi:IclR family transcriptional regulator [Ammoniphilus sp. 3BR4]|uniref:IclR family transcriptional regulator n=1 Tax=Ammoniphilus sp. 3BR4 TaxID=3158265 RepID=UPI0034678B77